MTHGRTHAPVVVRGLRRSRSAGEIAGARLRRDDATALHDLVTSVRAAVGEGIPFELVVTSGAGVLATGPKRRPRTLAIGFPLIVQAARTELLTLVAAAIADDRATRRRLWRMAFEWLVEPDVTSVLGPEAAATAVLREDLVRHLLADEFWPSVWSETATLPEPPADVFERMADFLVELPEARPGEGGALLPPATLARVARELSATWQAAIREQWHAAHATAAGLAA